MCDALGQLEGLIVGELVVGPLAGEGVGEHNNSRWEGLLPDPVGQWLSLWAT